MAKYVGFESMDALVDATVPEDIRISGEEGTGHGRATNRNVESSRDTISFTHYVRRLDSSASSLSDSPAGPGPPSLFYRQCPNRV